MIFKKVIQRIINIKDGICRMPQWRMAEPVNFQLDDNEHIAIVGPNGGGKSMLADIIVGKHPLLARDPEYDFAPSRKEFVADNIKLITFRDTYGGDNDRTYYLQQRWNQMEIDDETPTVSEILEKAYQLSGEDTETHRQRARHLYSLLGIDGLMGKRVIFLSSGELRKMKIAEALLTSPRVLIMDNPFIGLDSDTRDLLRGLLESLSREKALQIILILSKTDDIPDFITHVVEVRNMKVREKMTLEEYRQSVETIPSMVLSPDIKEEILSLSYSDNDYHAHDVVRMNSISIVYGEKAILRNVDWCVRNGEHWALGGPNGSGKSTLLSLICADNPQGYACDIELFGHKRGSGESIWDIKKHIGYVSPEMHRAYRRNIPCIRVVASGLKDSVGLYVRPTEEDYGACRMWMTVFGLQGKWDVPFLQLSSGEQRLVLLARAFVKDPELLILDEPLHGLDDYNRTLVRNVIDVFCQRRNKTLIMVSHYKEELPMCIDNMKELCSQEDNI